jgi:hypothetical protein
MLLFACGIGGELLQRESFDVEEMERVREMYHPMKRTVTAVLIAPCCWLMIHEYEVSKGSSTARLPYYTHNVRSNETC